MPRYGTGPGRAAGLHVGPGPATGPLALGDRLVVGEVTLHDRGDLPARLRAAGEPVEPDAGDLELLARTLVRCGPDALRSVEGAYTFAVVAPDGATTLVRDPVGARTAYWAMTPSGPVTGSSLRVVRERSGGAWRLDLPAVRTFLTFAYLPGAETLVEGVHEVPPGRVVHLPRHGAPVVDTLWEPCDVPAAAGDAAPRLRAALERAVDVRLPPGAEVGATVSGGIDSSLVAALAAARHDRPVRTYSISFGPELPDELGYSSLVASHLGTVHRELVVSGREVARRLAETVALLDNPVGDPLTVPNLMLAEAVAADGCPVALNGEGGDPVFGGPKNLPMLLWALHAEDPAAMATAYLRSYRKCGEDLGVLLTPDAHAALAGAPPLERLVTPWLDGPMTALLDRLLHVNLRTKGAHHILPKVERLFAARGVQARSPLFDRRVVDLAFGIPPRAKLDGVREKAVLKDAVADLLPATIVDRPKSGMQVPVQQWLRGPLRDLAGDALLSRAAADRGLLRRDTVRRWLDGRGSRYPRQGAKVWLALSLELWLRAHVD